MQEAKSQPTTPAPAVRRRRALSPVTGSNVVTLPKRPTGDEAIVAAVLAKSKQQDDVLLQHMRELSAALNARHRERANALLPLAMKMDRPTLDNFIEIGQRMLGARAGQ